MLPIIIASIESPEDRDMMTAFYMDYKGRMYTEARKFMNTQEDVEDMVYEALTRIIDKMDLFRELRPEQRSDERLSEPGGNLDRERLLAEVLLPRARGKEIAYRPFDCSTRTLGKEIIIPENSVLIVEGSYSLHPVLIKYYDLKIFLTVSETTQRKRLLSREGAAKAAVFSERWIPLEEAYFKATELSKICDMFFEIKNKSISFVQ